MLHSILHSVIHVGRYIILLVRMEQTRCVYIVVCSLNLEENTSVTTATP